MPMPMYCCKAHRQHEYMALARSHDSHGSVNTAYASRADVRGMAPVAVEDPTEGVPPPVTRNAFQDLRSVLIVIGGR